MKKIVALISLILILSVGSLNIDAQTKGKRGHHHKKSTWVKKNAEGYAVPTGHTYKFTDSGISATLEFITSEKVIATLSKGENSASTELTWTQNGDEICLPDLDPLKISKNGRTLTENTGKTFELQK